MARMQRFEQAGAVWSDTLHSINDLRKRGTVTGSPTLSAGPWGRAALTLDGTNDYWTSTGVVDVTGSTWSVCCWAYVDSSGSGYRLFFNSGNVPSLALAIDTNGKLAVNYNGVVWRTSTDAVPTDQWVHLGAVASATTVTFYVNGTANGTGIVSAITGGANVLNIGAYHNGTLKFKGALDEVMFFNRALTSDEISAIHAGTMWDYDKSLKALWMCDGINPKDLSHAGLAYDMTGVSLTAASIVDGPYNGGKALKLDGSADAATRTEANWRSSDSQGTIVALINRNVINALHTIFSSCDAGTNGYMLNLGIGVTAGYGNAVFIYNVRSGTVSLIKGSTSITTDRWYTVGMSSNGSSYQAYIDGVAETMTAVSGLDDGAWLSDATLRDNVNIGYRKVASPVQFFNGKIAEVRYYNTNLLPMQHADLNLSLKRQVA